MQMLIRIMFDKQKTCVAPTNAQSTSSLAPAAAKSPLGSRSFPQRTQLFCGSHGTRPIDRVVQTIAKRILMMTSADSSSSSTSISQSWSFAGALIAFVPLVLLLLFSVAVAEMEALTPEDVRFATLRCQNDSTNDPSLRLQWSLRMFPDNHETHCYVKCLLSKLGLINLSDRGLEAHILTDPLEIQDIDISEECLNHFDDVLSGTCESYYRKWIDLRISCKDFFYISLFEDPHEVDKFNNLNISQSKKLGETASEFCSKSHESPSSQNKELTSEQTLKDDILSIFKCELGCVFRHMRYFDVYGRVDKNEILRSFKDSNSNSKANNEAIFQCVHRSNSVYAFGPCQMAYELYQCFMKKVKNFKEIYAQRDKISRYF